MIETKTTVRGNLRVEINENGMSASLVFTPAVEGRLWDERSVAALIAENQLEKVQATDLKSALERFAAAPEARASVLIARGIKAVPGRTEIPDWKKLPVPEELSSIAEEVFASSAAPSIQIEEYVKVKREKIIRKKTGLPFMPEKVQRVTVVEKEKRTVPVNVDPAVEASGYARAGDIIANLLPGNAGMAGADVFGNIIKPPIPPEPGVYAGFGIDKQENRLVTTEEGFFRRGKTGLRSFRSSITT